MLYELTDPQAQFIREVLMGTRYEGNLQQIKQQSDLAFGCVQALQPKQEKSAGNETSRSPDAGSRTPH